MDGLSVLASGLAIGSLILGMVKVGDIILDQYLDADCKYEIFKSDVIDFLNLVKRFCSLLQLHPVHYHEDFRAHMTASASILSMIDTELRFVTRSGVHETMKKKDKLQRIEKFRVVWDSSKLKELKEDLGRQAAKFRGLIDE